MAENSSGTTPNRENLRVGNTLPDRGEDERASRENNNLLKEILDRLDLNFKRLIDGIKGNEHLTPEEMVGLCEQSSREIEFAKGVCHNADTLHREVTARAQEKLEKANQNLASLKELINAMPVQSYM